MNAIRALFKRWMCARGGHAIKERSVLYSPPKGGVSAYEQWEECDCGKAITHRVRRRFAQPYREAT